jgi:hypothetical protein
MVPDWRWMLDRVDSPWYPTMVLYRQTAMNDWNGFLVEFAADIAALTTVKAKNAEATCNSRVDW